MCDLKEVVSAEIQAVFLNPIEFGEMIVLDGHEVRAVLDHMDSDPLRYGDRRPDLGLERVRLFLSRAELPGRYSLEQRVHYNQQYWHVLDIKEHQGIVELDLYREAI